MLTGMPRRHRWSPICEPTRNLVRPVPVDPTSARGPTRGQARGGKWRRTTYGLYVPSWVDPAVPEQRIMEASMLLPRGGAVTGWAACRLWQANFFDGVLPDGRTRIGVPLCVGTHCHPRPRPGVAFLRDRLEAEEVVARRGIACVRERRALFDAMRTASDVREAVVAMEMMAAADATSVKRMRAYVDERAGWDGVPLVRSALALASERSKSPNETRMRLIWELDAGLPRPLVNRYVWSSRGRLLGIADILDPVAGVVGEFDGADHRGAVRHSYDVDREAGFRGHRLEFFRVTGPDIHHRRRVTARMRSAYGRALHLPEAQRTWTITPPPGWPPDESLDDFLDERDFRWSLYERWERE